MFKWDNIMLNKKLMILLLLILVILQISSVNAYNKTEFDIINEKINSTDGLKLHINNAFHEDNISESNEYNGNKMEFNQGDMIPIHINSLKNGELKVLVDDKEYGSWNFSKNETILIPTYNLESFDNDSIMNIDVGLHNISFIFNFKYYSRYTADISIDENSALTFQINKKYTTHDFTNRYTYNSTLNILKKEKSIHIVKFKYYNLIDGGDCQIHVDNYQEELIFYYGIIISNKEEIIYKERFYIPHVEFTTDMGLYYVQNVGFYNFAVVNLVDGTSDSIIFKASKYKPNLNISYIINESNITFQIINPKYDYYLPDYVITVDNLTKEIIMLPENGTACIVSFENLNHGIHTMTLYCYEYTYIESFFYEMTFKIGNNSSNPYQGINSFINQSNSDNNVSHNLTFIKGNRTGNNINLVGGDGKNHNHIRNSNSKKKNNVEFKEERITSAFGDIKSSDLSEDLSTQKSYEIVEKSILNSNHVFIQLSLIIIVFLSLVIGYFKFKKNNN